MAAGDLCTLAQVRAHAQFPDVETEQDPLIGDLITRWSKVISHYCSREFAPPATAASRTVEFEAFDTLINFDPYDARTVTAVVLDDGLDTEQTLTSASWRLELYDSANGVWRAIRLDGRDVNYTDIWPRRTLTVTGDWGFAAVPDDVREACVLAVTTTLRQNVQAFGSAIQPNSFGPDVNDAQPLPPGLRGLLFPYVRTVH